MREDITDDAVQTAYDLGGLEAARKLIDRARRPMRCPGCWGLKRWPPQAEVVDQSPCHVCSTRGTLAPRRARAARLRRAMLAAGINPDLGASLRSSPDSLGPIQGARVDLTIIDEATTLATLTHEEDP